MAYSPDPLQSSMEGQMFDSKRMSPSNFADLGDESQVAVDFFGSGNDMLGDEYSDDGSGSVLEDEQMQRENQALGLQKHIIYGALDGILTTFAIVAGGAGGALDTKKILIIGISNLIADALNMGLGDVLGHLSHHEYVLSQAESCKRQVRESKGVEIEAMTKIFTEKGLKKTTAKRVVEIMAKYDEFFTKIVMIEKFQLEVPEENEAPWNDGFITFCSFSCFGLIPLLFYCVVPSLLSLLHPTSDAVFRQPHFAFVLTTVTTLSILFVLGHQTNKFCDKHWLRCGCEFLFMGIAVLCVAASIGHATGTLLRTQFPFYFHDAP